jgi:hypothetical protein
MALTANTIPSQVTTYPCPYDATLAFCSAQTLTATGYFNNLNSGQIDLGGAAPVSAAGRTDFIWSWTSPPATSRRRRKLQALPVRLERRRVRQRQRRTAGVPRSRRGHRRPPGRHHPRRFADHPADQPRRHHSPDAGHQPDAAHLLPLSAHVRRPRRHHAVDHADVMDQPGQRQLLD